MNGILTKAIAISTLMFKIKIYPKRVFFFCDIIKLGDDYLENRNEIDHWLIGSLQTINLS